MENRALLASSGDLISLSSALGDDGPGELYAEGESATRVRFRHEITAPNGTPVSQVNVGDQFDFKVFVEDITLSPTGAFSPYLDIAFDTGLLTSGALTYGSTYANLPSGDTSQDGLIDELGAFAGIQPVGSGEFLLASIRFTATSAGAVNFVGNAADLSPNHDLLVYGSLLPLAPAEVDYGSATVTITKIIDNGDPGFSTSGAWTLLNESAYQNDVQFSAAGSGADIARWAFDVTPGKYRASATWNPHSNRASDAPFTIFDGATARSTVDINQEQAPNDFSAAGALWEDLGGSVDIFGSSLVVQLSDAANEFVIADAIRIERVGSVVPAPEIEVLDGSTNVADGSGDVDFGNTSPGAPVTKTLTVKDVGSQNLTLSTPISVPSGFTLVSGFGASTVTPGNSTSFQVRLDAVAEGSFSGPVSFGSNDSDENPFNFTIRGQVSTAPVIEIIDNGAAGFTTAGAWVPWNEPAYQGDIHFNAAGSGADLASWTFSVAPGKYRVSATWSSHSNRATDAPFTILDGATARGTVDINQEQAPNGFSDAGAIWEDLGGSFDIFGNMLVVQLSDAANDFVIADAIRIERVGSVAPAPEIEVLDGSTNVADGSGHVNFGNTAPGTPVTKTFTVKNVGSQNLTLSTPISVPAGFTLVSSFGSTTLAPSNSTNFQVRMDAGAAGSFSGSVSFGTNDSDENPFNFTIHGQASTAPVIEIIDNGAAGFTTSGAWVPWNESAYQGDIHFNAAGSGADVASWTFNVASGKYRVSATWSSHSNRATDAPFTILDGATARGTVDINQEQAPNDFSDAGAIWQDLGASFDIFGNILVVQLSDAANEYVIADAIRIERVGSVAPAPEIEVLDGSTSVADGSGDVNFGNTPPGTPVTKTFTVKNVGSQNLTLSTPINVPSGFTLASGFGSTTLAPGSSTSFQVRMDAGAAGSFSGSVSFGNNDSDENPFDFTIHGQASTAPVIEIIDNGAAGFSTSGAWVPWNEPAYQGDIHFNAAGIGLDQASWTFTVAPGKYRVSATWSSHPNRATDAPFSILDGATPRGTVDINQEQAPNDFSDAGAVWEDLAGSVDILGNTLLVHLSDSANEFVIADAIRIERVGSVAPAPEIEVLDGSTNVVDGSGDINFGNTPPGTPITKTFTVKNVGSQNLTLSTPISVPSGFTLVSSFGATTLAPGSSTSFQVRLDAAAAGSFSGPVSFGNNDGNENPFNFTIRGQASTAPVIEIIDNGAAGFSTSGAWTLLNESAYQNDIQFSQLGNGQDVASWTFNVAPGTYRVSATWSSHSNRATDAPFSILDGSNPKGTVDINQEQAPNDFNDAGANWEDLGNYQIVGSTLIVQLSDDANEYVIADAVRIERL